jgi:CRISPR-associated protein Cas1
MLGMQIFGDVLGLIKNFYVVSEGALSADQSVFRFDSKDKMTRIPVETVSAINLYGGVSVTSGAFNLASTHNVPFHFFGFYGNYIGTYWPKDAYFSGDLTIRQSLIYSNYDYRKTLSVTLLRGIYRNMRALLNKFDGNIEGFELSIEDGTIERIMLSEARLRKDYYTRLDSVLPEQFRIENRERRPPTNFGNSLLSFGNSLLYSEMVTQARCTSINMSIPFYHSPESGRFSLSLDLSEVFKPGLVDRLILSLTRQGIIHTDDHFHEVGNGILLNERGRKLFIQQWEAWLESASYNNRMKRKVSHRELIRMEIHKFAKEVEEIEPYKPLRLPVD